MITFVQAEAILRKSEVTLKEIEGLNDLNFHILNYEDGDNKKLQRLSRRIEKKVEEFFNV
jgi:hypothetical protein